MSALSSDLRLASPWRTALPTLVVVLAALLLLYRETALGMVSIWVRSDTFAHAFLVPPIALWLIWRRRAELAAMTPRPAPLMLLPIAAMALLWLVADLAAVNAATQLALVAMLVLSVPAVLGLQVGRALVFPLVFLFFSVPIGEFLMPALMEMTADFTVAALRLTGVPVYREGLDFIIPTGSWAVAEACSGVRYLIASFMVGTLFAYLSYRSAARRWAFVGVSILVPIVANWVRAYLIVMIGHLSGNKLAAGVDHIVYGWVFFGIVIGVMFLIGARWSEPEAPHPPAAPLPAPTGGGSSWRAVGVVVVLVALAPQLALRAVATGESAADVRLELPAALAQGWQAAPAPYEWSPVAARPRAQQNRFYAAAGAATPVGVHVAYYRRQGYQNKLISSDSTILRTADLEWSRLAEGARDVPAGDRSVRLRTVDMAGRPEISGVRRHLMAYQVYWVDGQFVASEAGAKLRGAAGRLLGRGDDAASVVFYARADSAAAAAAAVESFVSANLGAVEDVLRGVRERR